MEMAEAREGLQIRVSAPSVTASPACPSAPEARDSRCVVRLDLPLDWVAGAFRIMGHGAWRGNQYRTDAHLHTAAYGQCGRRRLQRPGAEAHHLKIFLCASVSPSVKRRDFTRSALPQQWDWRFFFSLRWTEQALKTVVRGFWLSGQLPGASGSAAASLTPPSRSCTFQCTRQASAPLVSSSCMFSQSLSVYTGFMCIIVFQNFR